MSNKPSKLHFFLGGADLEMATIRDLLTSVGATFTDKGLTWGAKASAYAQEIAAAIERDETPVIVELDEDMALPVGTVVVDHHGSRAGKNAPTSLHQVFALLDLPASQWTRRFELVAANDRGYIPAMIACGATMEEMREIRKGSRNLPPEIEAEAMRAIAARQVFYSGECELMIVRMAHSKTGVVCDALHKALGGPGYTNLVIFSEDGEANFYGQGWMVEGLHRDLGGWKGGSLPDYGFWGGKRSEKEVMPCILKHFRMFEKMK